MTEDFLKYFDIYASKFPCRKDSGDFLFKSSKESKPCEPKTMQKHFKAILKELKIKGPTFHSLRHTFATRAIEKNVDIKTLSALLGHADVSITVNIPYGHTYQSSYISILKALPLDYAECHKEIFKTTLRTNTPGSKITTAHQFVISQVVGLFRTLKQFIQ